MKSMLYSRCWQKPATQHERGSQMTSIVLPAPTSAPKIVGKALYLELVCDSTIPEDELRKLLGWQYKGTKQVIMFPEYQDDTGKIHGAVIMSRMVS